MAFIPVTVMPWHKPDPCLPPKMQTPAAFNSSYLEYQASLSIESKLLKCPLSSIMCTIGPSSNNLDALVDLLDGGMNLALVQMTRGSRDEIQDTIKLLQSAVAQYSTIHNRVIPLAIAVQLKPPGIHIGNLDMGTPVRLEAGDQIVLTTNLDWKFRGNSKVCYFDLPNAGDLLKRDDSILMDTGIVKLKVDEVSESKIMCRVESGGQLTNNMKVKIPGVPLHLSAVTEQDKDDLMFIANLSSVDIVVVSSVKSGSHTKEVRAILDQNNADGIMLFSRIDSKDGLDNIQEIVRESDGILLARNELGAEIEGQKLFLAQKIVFATSNKVGKPVYICANYMESMINIPTPMYTEIIDVQSAILDGADGIVLEDPISEGHFHHEVVKTVAEICIEAEAAVWQSQVFNSLLSLSLPPIDPTHAISISAVEASLKSCAAAIIVATTSGRSAQVVARYRPRCHIIAITRYGQVARQLNAWRAIIPVHYVTQPLSDWNKEVDIRLQMGIELGKEKGLICTGDPIVLLNGWRQGAGFTNTLRVVYASDSDPWVYPHDLPSKLAGANDICGFNELYDQRTIDHGTSYSLQYSDPSVTFNINDKTTSYHTVPSNDLLSNQFIQRSTLDNESISVLQHIARLNGTHSLRSQNGTRSLNRTIDLQKSTSNLNELGLTQTLGSDQNAGNLNANLTTTPLGSGTINLNITQNLGGQFTSTPHGSGSINLNRTQTLGENLTTTRRSNGSVNLNTTQILGGNVTTSHHTNGSVNLNKTQTLGGNLTSSHHTNGSANLNTTQTLGGNLTTSHHTNGSVNLNTTQTLGGNLTTSHHTNGSANLNTTQTLGGNLTTSHHTNGSVNLNKTQTLGGNVTTSHHTIGSVNLNTTQNLGGDQNVCNMNGNATTTIRNSGSNILNTTQNLDNETQELNTTC